MQLGSLNKKYKQLTVSVLLLIIMASAQVFIWRAVHARAIDLQQKKSQKEQIANVQARNDDIQQSLNQQKDFLNQLDVVVPPAGSLTQVVERVEQLADRFGLPLDISVIQQVPNAEVSLVEEIQPMVVTVAVTGSADQLFSFMDALEHIQELAVIQKWSVGSGRTPAAPAPSTSPGPVVTPVAQFDLHMDILFFLRAPTPTPNEEQVDAE